MGKFFTAPPTQMGFLRVSTSVACGASFSDAQTALNAILFMKSHRFVPDTVQADSLPVCGWKFQFARSLDGAVVKRGSVRIIESLE